MLIRIPFQNILSHVAVIAVCFGFAASALADDPPNPSEDTLATDENTALVFSLDAGATLVGTPDADGYIATTENGTIEDQGSDTYEYTPATDFSGEDDFQYELCETDADNNTTCETITVTIVVGDAGMLAVNGPANGSSHTLSPNDNIVVLYGKAPYFSPVSITVDGKNPQSANADGKGAWNFNLEFDEDEAGEHTILVEDRDGNTVELTITVVWEADTNEEDDTLLPGKDPEVATGGGRTGSCASLHTTPASSGLLLLALWAAFAWTRRRQTV